MFHVPENWHTTTTGLEQEHEAVKMPPSVAQLSSVAAQLAVAKSSKYQSDEAATALRACFPQGAYLRYV